MKYWVFQNNQVIGPYEPDDLAQLPGYGADSLVCAEGRKGTHMGDWQRASLVPELSVSLLKASQLTAVGKGVGGGLYGGLPPEPTLRDLAALGSLQEKVSVLDGTVGQLQEALRLKENEILSLHRELEEKNRQAQELALKLGGLEERLGSVQKLREELDKTAAAEHDLESKLREQDGVIAALQERLERLQGELEQARSAPAAKAFAEPSAAPAPEGASPFAPPAAGGAPGLFPRPPLEAPAGLAEPPARSPFAADAPPPFAAAPSPAPAFEIPAPEPAAAAPLEPAPVPAAGFDIPASAPGLSPFPSEPPAGLTQLPSAEPASLEPAAPEAPAAADLLVGAPVKAPPPPRSRKGLLALLGLLIVGGAGFGALKLGLVVPPAPAPASAPAEPPPPVPELEPAAPTPQDLEAARLEEQKRRALALLREWPTPSGAALGAAIENEAPPSGLGGMGDPWFADRVGEQVYQVHYQAKSLAGTQKRYEFEVHLADRKVTAINDAARALLAPPPSVRQPRPKVAKKAAPADAGGPLLQDLLDLSLSEPSSAREGSGRAAPAPAPAPPAAAAPRRQRRDVDKELDELIGPPQEPARSRPASPREESLDEILLPGRQAGPREPAAQPARGEAPAPRRPAKSQPKAADADLLDDLLKP